MSTTLPSGPAGREPDGEGRHPSDLDTGPVSSTTPTGRGTRSRSARQCAAAGRGTVPPSPRPVPFPFRPWPGVLPAGGPPLLPAADRLPHGDGTVWAVVAQYDDGRPSEVVVAFPSDTAAETFAVTSDDVARYTVVPVRFLSSPPRLRPS